VPGCLPPSPRARAYRLRGSLDFDEYAEFMHIFIECDKAVKQEMIKAVTRVRRSSHLAVLRECRA
jgi:hypothetical protein